MLLLRLALAHATDLQEPPPECPTEVPAINLQATLDAVEIAYGAGDDAAVSSTTWRAQAELPCVREQVTPSLAAQMHRVVGLEALSGGRREASLAAFAAARTIEPSYQFPDSVAAQGSPAFDQYVSAIPANTFTLAPPSRHGELYINGRATRDRPTESPAVVQVLDRTGEHPLTAYLWPDDPVPYAAGSTHTPAQRTALVGGAAAAVLGTASLVTGAIAPAGEGRDRLTRSRTRTGFLGTGGALLAAGGVGIGLSFALPSIDARSSR
jgi:hypothetical protein